MPEWLDRRFSVSDWTTRRKRRSAGSISFVSQPGLDEWKQLFVTIRSMAATDVMTANLSRAVVEIVRQYGIAMPASEVTEFDELMNRWEIEQEPLRERRESLIASSEHKLRRSFLDNARRLDQRGQTDAALDLIFDQIDETLLAGRFDQVDQLLMETTPGDFSAELLLGILTATLPAKSQLPARSNFFRRVEETLQAHGELKHSLLVGLD